MARMLGVSNSYIHGIWRRNGIKPHLTRTFKVSTDPAFAAKFWDVIGLYLAPPVQAVVFCYDEKTPYPALWNTPSRACRTGAAHTHREWIAFLKHIDRNSPQGLDIHVIADNYATHKHGETRKWLRRHKRFRMHYTPTSSSWKNLVERFFREITRECIRDVSFGSVRELESAIEEHIRTHNEAPKRFVWEAEGLAILSKNNRARNQLGMAPLPTEPPSEGTDFLRADD